MCQAAAARCLERGGGSVTSWPCVGALTSGSPLTAGGGARAERARAHPWLKAVARGGDDERSALSVEARAEHVIISVCHLAAATDPGGDGAERHALGRGLQGRLDVRVSAATVGTPS